MATTQQSTVVGVFEDRAMAEQAVAELRQAGFNDNQISFSGHGASTGGILSGLKSLFSKQATAEDHVFDDLVGMGMPQEDATYYQQEYEAGRSIVAVTGGSRMPEAATILSRYGAYSANRRSAQTADYGTAASTAAQQTAADTEGERHVQL